MATGLLIPVLVLLLIDRGLTLGQLGLVFAAQGLMVLLLELPTGGLADAIGRRPVLLLASLFEAASIALLIFSDSLPLLALVFALQGVYRALESGPLDSWYVDTAQALDPDADIERGLSRGGAVLGIAIGVGALSSSALVASNPIPGIEPLVTPLIGALVLRFAELIAIALLMVEERVRKSRGWLRRAVSAVPEIVSAAIATVRSSGTLIALVTIEFLWGFGMVSFETFTPAKLEVVMGSSDQAATLLGPASAVAWVVAGASAMLVPMLTRRMGASIAAAVLMTSQGIMVFGIALALGPVGVVLTYVAIMGIHGAANPIHQGLLHRAVDNPRNRATVVSANSMTAQTGGMLGGIGLGFLADQTSLTVAIVAGGLALIGAAPLYVLTRRRPVRIEE